MLLLLDLCSLLILKSNKVVQCLVTFLVDNQRWFFWLCSWELVSSRVCLHSGDIRKKKAEVKERLSQKYWLFSQSYQVGKQAIGVISNTHWSCQKVSHPIWKLSDDGGRLTGGQLFQPVWNSSQFYELMYICIFSIPALIILHSGFSLKNSIHDTASCFPGKIKKSRLCTVESGLEQTFLSFKKEKLTLLIW